MKLTQQILVDLPSFITCLITNGKGWTMTTVKRHNGVWEDPHNNITGLVATGRYYIYKLYDLGDGAVETELEAEQCQAEAAARRTTKLSLKLPISNLAPRTAPITDLFGFGCTVEVPKCEWSAGTWRHSEELANHIVKLQEQIKEIQRVQSNDYSALFKLIKKLDRRTTELEDSNDLGNEELERYENRPLE